LLRRWTKSEFGVLGFGVRQVYGSNLLDNAGPAFDQSAIGQGG
jgi:hypothetical protein